MLSSSSERSDQIGDQEAAAKLAISSGSVVRGASMLARRAWRWVRVEGSKILSFLTALGALERPSRAEWAPEWSLGANSPSERILSASRCKDSRSRAEREGWARKKAAALRWERRTHYD